MHVFLETERLVLRRFTAADVGPLVDLDSDPDVMRYLNGGVPTPRDVIENEVLPAWLRYYERFAGYGFWAAIEKTTGEFLGWFHFRPPPGNAPDDIELGYRLRQSAWGKGYATEASRALIWKGFTELGVRRVFAGTAEANVASRRVMEKSGLTLARTYPFTPTEELLQETYRAPYPEFFGGNDIEYELLKADWEQQQAADAPRTTNAGNDHRF